jgi:hypothetical protein
MPKGCFGKAKESYDSEVMRADQTSKEVRLSTVDPTAGFRFLKPLDMVSRDDDATRLENTPAARACGVEWYK